MTTADVALRLQAAPRAAFKDWVLTHAKEYAAVPEVLPCGWLQRFEVSKAGLSSAGCAGVRAAVHHLAGQPPVRPVIQPASSLTLGERDSASLASWPC